MDIAVLGKVGTLIGLRSKKVITKKIHITRCESKEERFARIRADLKVSVNNIHCNYCYKYFFLVFYKTKENIC